VRPLRAFCKEKDECDEFRSESNALAAEQTFVGRISALLNPLTFVLVNLGILVLLHTGALSVDGGALTQGEVIALYNLMGQILVELIKLANLIVTITKAVASMHRIDAAFEISPSQEEVEESPTPVSGADAVTFRAVRLTYAGAGDASLSDISFSVPKGATVGVIGGTGSGKSTLVSLLLRHYDATGGEILLDGADIRNYPREVLTKRIAYVPQKAALFSGTLRENLTWRKKDASDEELWSALRIAQADGFILEKGGLDTPVAQGGKNFSGGQRQRLTVARALVGDFDLLVLDDATSALDYATDAALRRALRDAHPDATKFIVSQRASALLDADLILTLEDGELVGAGRHEELLDSCAVYREIFESQLYREEA
jgi:ABC-type multidrug transport system fused ATPase/permease subunit